jgi:tetratricopeptide (TPR) repeat protein
MKNDWHLAACCPRFAYATVFISAISLFPVAVIAADRESVFQEAREHLQQGRATNAFDLLSQYELDWAGEDAFDYLFGISALDSDNSGEAIFSLQRLMARQPDFAGARMDLARAYYNIGDNELARVEFNRVLADNPPAKVREAASEYLTAIDAKARAYKSDPQYYFDFGLGYDSNAPAATDDAIFLSFRLSDNNLEASSSFAHAAVGGLWNFPVSPDSQILVNARIDHRANPSTHYVDASNIDLGIGWSWKSGKNSVSVAANTIFAALASKHNKNDYGITASYQRQLNQKWVFSSFIKAGSMRFEESELEVRDVDQVIYGMSVSQTYSNAQFNFSVTGNTDDAKQSNSPFSADGYGINLSNSWFLSGGKVVFIDAGFSNLEYDDAFFGFNREDDITTFGAGAIWSKFPKKDWTTTFRVNYSEKESTVSLYEFERVEIGLSFNKSI